jgi:hypothetical protein
MKPPKVATIWDLILCAIFGHDPHRLGRSTIIVCQRCGVAARMFDE